MEHTKGTHYSQGFDANKLGMQPDANPCPEGSDEYLAWRNGYLAAHDKSTGRPGGTSEDEADSQ